MAAVFGLHELCTLYCDEKHFFNLIKIFKTSGRNSGSYFKIIRAGLKQKGWDAG